AALFVGNLLALLRRRTPATAPHRAAPDGAPPDAAAGPDGEGGPVLQRAPVGRTVAFMALGFVVAIWGLASLLAS
ncbi:MAG TPA: hypothetical protein VEG38_01415, partial [Acidimicrobiia bacterium]|nr:hypothetical protein [Acidimicrobiia bacterium]